MKAICPRVKACKGVSVRSQAIIATAKPARFLRASRPSLRTFAQQDGTSASEPEKEVEAKAAKDASSSGTSEETEEASTATEAEEELDVVEKLRVAILAKDLEDATTLVDAVVAEVDGLASIVEAAEAEKKATQTTLDQLKDQYRRLQADFDNFRTRANNEKQQAGANAKMSMIEDLLPLIDGFELAASQVKTETPGEEKINNSYQGLYKKMVDIFRGMGLEAVPTEGHMFDPEIHDGIMREENSEVENGTILQEFRKGFRFKDKLLRPAMVKVAYSDTPAPQPESVSSAAE